ncbi:MAG: hypothetical protein WD066_14460 [Planctomycetaceae bacterium]
MIQVFVPSGTTNVTTWMKIAGCPSEDFPETDEEVKYGRICVVGLGRSDTNIAQAYARVYYGTDPGAPSSRPPADAQKGVVLIVEQLWPPGDPLGVYYNFRFIVEPDQDRTVCQGGDAVGGDGDVDNWLVVWIQFTGDVWEALKVRIKCLAVGFTDCQCGKWYDSFTDTNGVEVVDHVGEVTVGDPPYSGSDDWTIQDDAATGTVPKNQNNEILFDPGITAYDATHRLRFPSAPQSEQWTLWALRSFRRADVDSRFHWQIGWHHDQPNDPGTFFHELIEWHEEGETVWDFAYLQSPPAAGFVDCEAVVTDDYILVSYDGEPLFAETDTFADQTGQAFDTYYDVGENEPPATKTAFDTLCVRAACPSPSQTSLNAQRASASLSVAGEEAIVLSETALGPGPGRRVRRPCGISLGYRGEPLRWTDLAQRFAGLDLSIHRVRGRSLAEHVGELRKDPRCFVLCYDADPEWERDTSMSAADRDRVGALLAQHGIGGVDTSLPWRRGALADATTMALRQINTRRRLERRLKVQPRDLAKYDRQIAELERLLATTTGDERQRLERRVAQLVLRREGVRCQLHDALRIRSS